MYGALYSLNKASIFDQYLSFFISSSLVSSLYPKVVSFNGFRWSKPSTVEAARECVICLEDWETGKQIPCVHSFHRECIERLLGIHGSCPVFQFRMPADVEAEKEEGRGVEGGIWISLFFDVGTGEAERANEDRNNSVPSD